MIEKPILSVKNLKVSFTDDNNNQLVAVSDVSFDLKHNSSLGIVGESGCGKSVTSLAIMRLLPQPHGKILSGQVLLAKKQENGTSNTSYLDFLQHPKNLLHKIRGKRIAMIFQNPMTSLNPVHRVGKQIKEALQIHFPDMSKNQIQDRIIDLLNRVGIPDPKKRQHDFPHQLSGGMRQRIVIAIALACDPDILIADEPTTALDVTIQAQILDLIQELKSQNNMSVILITHDIAVVSENCDYLAVMYAGKIVEQGSTLDILSSPKHPYTQALLKTMPSLSSQPKTFLPIITGMVPSLIDMPKGCRFANRCGLSIEICSKNPELEKVGDRYVACHRHDHTNTTNTQTEKS